MSFFHSIGHFFTSSFGKIWKTVQTASKAVVNGANVLLHPHLNMTSTQTTALLMFLPTVGELFGGPLGMIVTGFVAGGYTAYAKGNWTDFISLLQ